MDTSGPAEHSRQRELFVGLTPALSPAEKVGQTGEGVVPGVSDSNYCSLP